MTTSAPFERAMPQRVCPNPSCPYAAQHGTPARFRAQTAACNDCGAALVDDTSAAPAPSTSASAIGAAPRAHSIAGAVVATLAIAALYPVLGRIPLPYIHEWPKGFLGLFDGASWRWSVAALGLQPWTSGFVLVEIVAVLVPALRPMRHDARRRNLVRAGFVVGAACALVQAWGVARSLASVASDDMSSNMQSPPAFVGPLYVALLLVGACVAPLAVALLSRRVAGNGWTLIIAGMTLWNVLGAIVETVTRVDNDEFTPMSAVVALTCIAVPAFIAWRLVQPFDDVAHPDPAYAPRPSAGAWPTVFAIATPSLIASVARLAGVSVPNRGDLATTIAGAVVAVVVLYAFAVAFVRDPASRKRAFLSTAVFNAVLFATWALAARISLPLSVDAVVVAQAVAIGRDIALELRHRRQHGGLVAVSAHWRFDDAARALSVLAGASIAAVPRGAHYRALLHFFAPLVPIEVLVPVADVERARAVLATLPHASTSWSKEQAQKEVDA